MADSCDEDGLSDGESRYEAWVFIGTLIAMGIIAVTLGIWTWLAWTGVR
jgi:hypothetical protein